MLNSERSTALKTPKSLIYILLAKWGFIVHYPVGNINAMRYREIASKRWSIVLTKYSAERTFEMLGEQLGGSYIIPDHDPVPKREDGSLDWSQVTAIKILVVEDTHG